MDKLELIVEVGGTNSNSYVDLEEADVYFSGRLNSDLWFSSSVLNRTRSLVQATSMIDSVKFAGAKANPKKVRQSLEWPRIAEQYDPYMLGIPHLSKVFKEFEEWEDEKGQPHIPIPLKKATLEQALFLLRSIKGLDKRDSLRAQGLTSFSYEGISESLLPTDSLCPISIRYLNQLNCYEEELGLSRG